jgi:hypothetical protein
LQSPVHSAHVGDEVEVHYRWHPYFGRTVCIRRVDLRATGVFFQVLGPVGIVVMIAGWMIDPVTCASMIMGAARVDLAALIELQRLVNDGDKSALFPSGYGIAQEEDHETLQYAGAELGSADEPDIRNSEARRARRQGTGEGGVNARPDLDASCRSQSRGAK